MTGVVVNTTGLAAKINAAHQEAYGNARKAYDKAREAFESAAECGRLLIEAKKLVGHGQWLPWLEANTKSAPDSVRSI